MEINLFVPLASKDALERIEHALAHLINLEGHIMSAISDFKVKQDAHNAQVSSDLAALATSIQAQNDLIAKIQGSAGAISAEDQATLDQLDANGKALADKADALA